jgi:hypothetical protein
MSNRKKAKEYAEQAIWHLDRAEQYTPEYMSDKRFQYHITASQVYTELAKMMQGER